MILFIRHPLGLSLYFVAIPVVMRVSAYKAAYGCSIWHISRTAEAPRSGYDLNRYHQSPPILLSLNQLIATKKYLCAVGVVTTRRSRSRGVSPR